MGAAGFCGQFMSIVTVSMIGKRKTASSDQHDAQHDDEHNSEQSLCGCRWHGNAFRRTYTQVSLEIALTRFSEKP
jgi:hypothetical protein